MPIICNTRVRVEVGLDGRVETGKFRHSIPVAYCIFGDFWISFGDFLETVTKSATLR